MVLVVDVKLAVFTRYWTFLNCSTLLFLSIGVFFGYMFLVDRFNYFLVFNTAYQLFTTFHYGLLVLALSFIIFAFDMLVVILKKECYPSVSSLYLQILKSKREKASSSFRSVNAKYKAPDLSMELTASSYAA